MTARTIVREARRRAPQDDERRVLEIPEAARQLGIGRASAYSYAKRGILPTVRLGRRLLVPKAALEDLLRRVRQDGDK